MKTVGVVNSKGGVGKTTLSITLASGLAGAGMRVVLVDTDPQGNVSKWFNMPEESGIYNLLIKEQPVSDLLRLVEPVQWWPDKTGGVLAILPGNYRTTTAGVAMAVDRSPVTSLRRALEPLQNSIDYVVLDTSPTVTELMSNILVASDYIIIPTETRILSVNGVTKTIDRIHEFQESINLGILGIVPTRHVSRQVECQENLKELQAMYGDLVWDAIAERTPWSESPSFAKSIFSYAPRSHKAVKEASLFVGTFLRTMQSQGVY